MKYLISYSIDFNNERDIASFIFESFTKITPQDLYLKLKEKAYAHASSIDNIPKRKDCDIYILSFSLFL